MLLRGGRCGGILGTNQRIPRLHHAELAGSVVDLEKAMTTHTDWISTHYPTPESARLNCAEATEAMIADAPKKDAAGGMPGGMPGGMGGMGGMDF